MANWDNHATKQVQSEMQACWDEGFVAGLEANLNQVPAWWWNTPPGRMGPYQRGYYVGREMQATGILPKDGEL